MKIAIEEGGRLVTGGKRCSNPALADGCFFEPTIIADVTDKHTLFNEEVFGRYWQLQKQNRLNMPLHFKITANMVYQALFTQKMLIEHG